MGTPEPAHHRAHAALVGHLVAQVAMASMGREAVLRLPSMAGLGAYAKKPHGAFPALWRRNPATLETPQNGKRPWPCTNPTFRLKARPSIAGKAAAAFRS